MNPGHYVLQEEKAGDVKACTIIARRTSIVTTGRGINHLCLANLCITLAMDRRHQCGAVPCFYISSSMARCSGSCPPSPLNVNLSLERSVSIPDTLTLIDHLNAMPGNIKKVVFFLGSKTIRQEYPCGFDLLDTLAKARMPWTSQSRGIPCEDEVRRLVLEMSLHHARTVHSRSSNICTSQPSYK